MPRHNLKEKKEKAEEKAQEKAQEKHYKNDKTEPKKRISSKKTKLENNMLKATSETTAISEIPETPTNINIEIEEKHYMNDAINRNDSKYSQNETIDSKSQENIPLSKKRGRKPKGGKLISKSSENELQTLQIPNIILHLKCSLSDLTDYNNVIKKMVTNDLSYNPEIPPEIQTYNSDNIIDNFSKYENISQNVVENEKSKINYAYSESTNIKQLSGKIIQNTCQISQICSVCNTNLENSTKNENIEEKNITNITNITENEEISMKDINYKLKHLKINLYKNTLQDKKSACFWCTYDYDNQPCYIPKYEMDDKIHGYGSFCRPECAVAYLMRESLDDSTKFERYHLLNHIYSKVYKYKKNIKPAPNPYYILDRFYGNLSIQEYRKLLKTEHLLTVIEKPMSRILPELYEDNDNFLLGIYGNVSKTSNTNSNNTNANTNNNVYKVKRQSEQTITTKKSTIMKERLNLS